MLIMYVDDEKAPREVITELLQALGHTVDTFSDPRAALRHYRTTSTVYHLVITDYRMPVLTGLDLAALVRGVNPKQKILVVTGDHEFVERAMKNLPYNPVDKVLGKPFGLVTLQEAITGVYGG